MLRVGYPETITAELFSVFPREVEMIPLSNMLDHDIAIDVWIPDPYPTRASRIAPHLRGLKLVLSLMAGTEWIPAAVGPHVTICNARGAHNIATAEWTLSAMLAMLKYIPLYVEGQRASEWKSRPEIAGHYAALTGDTHVYYPPVMQEELTGKSVLLVGYGSIGREIERVLMPFRVSITRVAQHARPDPQVFAVSDLDRLLPRAEIVILIVPSTPETHHLIGQRQCSLMKQGALLVNAARGPIVHTNALADALNAGRIRAALDVTDPEPLPADHALWRCPNLLITPHIGGSSQQFARRAIQIALDELRRYIAGEPLRNVVQAAV